MLPCFGLSAAAASAYVPHACLPVKPATLIFHRHGSSDERKVGKSLREIAKHLSETGSNCSEKSPRSLPVDVARAKISRPRHVDPAVPGIPPARRTGDKGSFPLLQTIGAGGIAPQKPPFRQILPNGIDGANHARVIERYETCHRHEQEGSVQVLPSEGLHEDLAFPVVSLVFYGGADLSRILRHFSSGGFALQLLGQGNALVDR